MKGGIVIILASVVALIGLTLPEVNSQGTVTICQGTFGRIDCGMNNVVIESASYGRNGNIICPSGQANTASPCSEDVTDIWQNLRCSGRTTCYPYARSSWNGNGCPSYPQAYLEVMYTCAIPTTTEMTTAPTTEMTTAPTTQMTTAPTTEEATTTMQPTTLQPTTITMQPTVPPATILTPVCQGTFGTINCGLNNVTICSASYGRNGNIICPSGQANTASSCSEDVTDTWQNQRCSGRTTCYPYARSSWNGNGCASHPQAYLEVTYTCAPEGCPGPALPN